jgi:membrane protein implicated in regulation of membrane protease activity
MGLVETIAGFGGWAFVVAGLVLLGLELVVPGGILLWLGVAGIVTGLAALFQPIAWPFQFLIFGVLSLILITGWLRYFKGRETPTDRPFLNRRADSVVGHEAALDEPIVNGFGRLALGDTIWRIAGPDLPVGSRIRVVGAQGAVLRIEPVDQRAPRSAS